MSDFYNVDFDLLKEEFKTFLKTSDTFKDYNFEGSAISNLLDLLTYFEQYGISYLNFTSNELFLDTAQIADNVYKLAHMLNYVPKRNVSPKITITMTKEAGSVDVYVPAYSKFQLGTDIFLTNLDDINFNTDSMDVELYEGEWVEEEFTSDGTDFQTYQLLNRESIDNRFLNVFVYPFDGTNNVPDLNPWAPINNNIFDSNGKNFFIRYFEKMFIRFDDGRLFTKPSVNELIVVKYLNTNGATHNNKTGNLELISTFQNSDLIKLSTTNVLENGTDAESLTSIKNNAPLFYSTQYRAVTEKDYNIIIKKYDLYDTLKDSYIWSGHREYISRSNGRLVEFEEGAKRDLGYAYFSALKSDYTYLDDAEIELINQYFENFRYLMTFHKFLQPNILFIEPTISIKYNNFLNINQGELDSTITDYLDSFIGFNKQFNLSNFIRTVDALAYIKYIDINYLTFVKVYLDKSHKVVRLWDSILPTTISGTVDSLEFRDDGAGNITLDSNIIGTVNYSTGFIEFETGNIVDTFIEFKFEFEDLLSISIQRETFFNYRNVQKETI